MKSPFGIGSDSLRNGQNVKSGRGFESAGPPSFCAGPPPFAMGSGYAIWWATRFLLPARAVRYPLRSSTWRWVAFFTTFATCLETPSFPYARATNAAALFVGFLPLYLAVQLSRLEDLLPDLSYLFRSSTNVFYVGFLDFTVTTSVELDDETSISAIYIHINKYRVRVASTCDKLIKNRSQFIFAERNIRL